MPYHEVPNFTYATCYLTHMFFSCCLTYAHTVHTFLSLLCSAAGAIGRWKPPDDGHRTTRPPSTDLKRKPEERICGAAIVTRRHHPHLPTLHPRCAARWGRSQPVAPAIPGAACMRALAPAWKPWCSQGTCSAGRHRARCSARWARSPPPPFPQPK